MADRTTMNISLTPELEKFVHARVQTGMYQSASEVMREALRLLQERETERASSLEALRARLTESVAQARRGEVRDGKEFFEQLLGKKKKLRNRSA